MTKPRNVQFNHRGGTGSRGRRASTQSETSSEPGSPVTNGSLQKSESIQEQPEKPELS
ncbi:hypothetical protein LTS18_013184, partial [Coniosporium uncinatum]